MNNHPIDALLDAAGWRFAYPRKSWLGLRGTRTRKIVACDTDSLDVAALRNLLDLAGYDTMTSEKHPRILFVSCT